MKIHATTTTAAIAAALVLAAASPGAAANPRVQLSGLGAYAITGSAAAYGADLYGRPYTGHGTGTVDLADGTPFPTPGHCEPATSTLRLVDAKGRSYALAATGEVCGSLLPLGVIERFLGRYVITSASQRGLVGTVGHLDVRLLGGEVSVYAIQS